MTEIPNRKLTPAELEAFKKESALKKEIDALEQAFTKRAEQPSVWFGRLLAAFLVALFLDITGWIAAFLDGGLYYLMANTLQAVETVSIVGMAGLAIYGSIESYKHQNEVKELRESWGKDEEG